MKTKNIILGLALAIVSLTMNGQTKKMNAVDSLRVELNYVKLNLSNYHEQMICGYSFSLLF